MGRTSKFVFPIPGQKPKKPAVTLISSPLTKAEKILGTGGISIDSPTPSQDGAWKWDTSSATSGMPVSVSDSSASWAGETGLGVTHEDDMRHDEGWSVRWDDESAVIPPLDRLQNVDEDSAAGASSLRRQASSSTIMSYYDKSKLPLSISQQTSNSAMAKGVPKKATALLDMDGTIALANAPKKKPARLDLSYLLPTSRRRRQSQLESGPVPRSAALRNSASHPNLSPDGLLASDLPMRRRAPAEAPRDAQLSSPSDLVSPPPSAAALARGKRSGVELHVLYEHYEQCTFQNMMDEQDLGFPTPPPSATKKELEPQPSAARGRRRASPTNARADSAQVLPTVGAGRTGLVSPAGDCSASTSSAKTKASRRSDRVIADFDLQQSSVLALSSDSEDDAEDSKGARPRTSISMPDRSARDFLDDESVAAVTPVRISGPRPKTAGAHAKHISTQRASADPQLSPPGYPVKAPAINARTSSLSLSSAFTARHAPLSSRSTSRASLGSEYTSNSMTTLPRHARTALRPPKQLKAITMIPATPINHNQRRRSSSQLSRSSEQPTPPLSPTSVDFFLQSQHNSMLELDIGSIRSGRSGLSLPTISESQMLSSSSLPGHTQQRSSSVGAPRQDSNRFMAVTPQEEMLLAAMRRKRADMRENIIAEFEEKPEKDFEDMLLSSGSESGSRSQPTGADLQQPRKSSTGSAQLDDDEDDDDDANDTAATIAAARAAQHSRQSSYSSTVTGILGKAPAQVALESARELVVPPQPRRQVPVGMRVETNLPVTTKSVIDRKPTGYQPPPTLSAVSARALPLSSHFVGTPRSPYSPTPPAISRGREHIALLFERPSPSPATTSATEASEPSPDLSDFMVFDDGSEDFPYQTPSSDDGQATSGSSTGESAGAAAPQGAAPSAADARGRLLSPTSHGPGSQSRSRRRDMVEPASPQSASGGSMTGSWGGGKGDGPDVRVRIVEDELVGGDGASTMGGLVGVDDEGVAEDDDAGIPRPDSPIASIVPVLPKKKAARLSAVGGVEAVGGAEEDWRAVLGGGLD